MGVGVGDGVRKVARVLGESNPYPPHRILWIAACYSLDHLSYIHEQQQSNII